MTVWLHTHLPRLQSGETLDVISVKVPGQRVEYASWVSLRNARFVVHERGRQRCIREGVRNVHAWVVGDEVCRVTEENGLSVPPRCTSWRRAVYDPWKGRTFVDSETLDPVFTADMVIMRGKNVHYVATAKLSGLPINLRD